MALEYVRRGVRASSGGLVPDDVSAMTTAIIGTGGIGSAIASQLASGHAERLAISAVASRFRQTLPDSERPALPT